MPADATTLLTAVAEELADLYPAVPVLTRKAAPPGGGVLPAWGPGDPAECFVLAIADPEEIDDEPAGFEEVAVSYRVTVARVRTYAPMEGDDDATIRDVAQAVRRRLYKPRLAALPGLADVALAGTGVYEAADRRPLTRWTGWAFTFVTTEPRPE